MLDSRGFNKKLKTISLKVKEIHEDLQEMAIYAIDQVFKDNFNTVREMLHALTKEVTKDGKQQRQYVTADAQRVMQFISDFCPITIEPTKGTARKSQARANAGMEWRGEDGYPKWYDWTHAPTPPKIREVDGIAILLASVENVMKKVKDGKVIISAETRPVFDRIFLDIENLIKDAAAKSEKAHAAKVEVEQNQRAAARRVGANESAPTVA